MIIILNKIIVKQADHRHVMIIDDSNDMRALLEMLLESQGYTTDCKANGLEALELLNSSNSNTLPHLILLDLRMPKMDGTDFVRLKQQSIKLKDIPVIMITGEDDITSLEAKIDFTEILTKPLHIKSLLEAVERNILH